MCLYGFASVPRQPSVSLRPASTAICAVASVHRQPFVPLHRATALCGCLYASLHNDFVRPLSCILCTFMNALLVSHPCETLGVHFIRHPCTTRKLRVLPPPAPKIIPRLLSGVLFLVPMAGVEPARYCYQRILSYLLHTEHRRTQPPEEVVDGH